MLKEFTANRKTGSGARAPAQLPQPSSAERLLKAACQRDWNLNISRMHIRGWVDILSKSKTTVEPLLVRRRALSRGFRNLMDQVTKAW